MKKALIFSVIILFLGCEESKKKTNKRKNTLENISYLVDLEGYSYNTSKLKGKKVLINHWATWCGPCKKEMPDLLEAQEILAKENYVFLLVSDESQEKIVEFKNKMKYGFTYLKSTKLAASLGIYALPTTFIYNDKGEVVDKIIGSVKWNSPEMIAKLKNIK
jgi:thiol-disulfide isomerase/thioredoxin